MNKSKFLLAIVVIILITAIILRIKDALNNENDQVIIDNSIEEELKEEKEIIEEEEEIALEFKVEIIEPSEAELISSPFLVKGLIFYDNLEEKELYLVLVDDSFDIIILEKIDIEKAWINENRVPFSILLEFEKDDGNLYVSIREKINNQLISLENFNDILINIKD